MTCPEGERRWVANTKEENCSWMESQQSSSEPGSKMRRIWPGRHSEPERGVRKSARECRWVKAAGREAWSPREADARCLLSAGRGG